MCLQVRKPLKMPVRICRYLKAPVSKQSMWFFSGVVPLSLRGSWDVLPQAGGRVSPAAAPGKAAGRVSAGLESSAGVQHRGGKADEEGWPTHVISLQALEMPLQPGYTVLHWLHSVAGSWLIFRAAGTQKSPWCAALAELEWQCT